MAQGEGDECYGACRQPLYTAHEAIKPGTRQQRVKIFSKADNHLNFGVADGREGGEEWVARKETSFHGTPLHNAQQSLRWVFAHANRNRILFRLVRRTKLETLRTVASAQKL